MIHEALNGESEEADASFAPKKMLLLALATSIDALAIGITLALLSDINIFYSVGVIGGITFVLSALGIKIGNLFGVRFKARAEIFGGILLILIGTNILCEHMGVWNALLG